jgi:predicted CXXCH cytochrome family protein
MRYPNTDSSLCLQCHRGYRGEGSHPEVKVSTAQAEAITAAGGVIGRGGRLICESCHTVHGSAGPSLTILSPLGPKGLCRLCHAADAEIKRKGGGDRSHPMRRKAKSGAGLPLTEEGELDCWTCHRTHRGSRGTPLLRQGFSGDQACQSCHDKQPMTALGKHRTIASGETPCRGCHRVHGAWGAGLLATPGDPDALCRDCHADHYKKEGKSGNHPLGPPPKETRISPKILLAGGRLGPRGEINCATCHRVHPPKGIPSLLILSPDILCFYCHPSLVTTEGLVRPPGMHPVKVKVKDQEIRKKSVAAFPLSSRGEIVCLTCHRVHGSERRPLLRSAASASPSSGCLTCHPGKTNVSLGKHNLILRSPSTENRLGETPNVSGVCGACHLAHGWARDPLGGADLVSGLCWSCHNKKGPDGEILVDNLHPLKRLPIGMTTTLPLLDERGIRDPKGGVACVTCHDPHQWNPQSPEARVRPKEAGSAATSFLRLPNDAAGLLCLDCHKEKRGLLAGAHDLVARGVADTNIRGETPAKAGPCGVCHLPHGSDPLALWARPKVAGRRMNPVNGLCLGCHMAGQIAAGKSQEGFGHPSGRVEGTIGKATGLPLYDSRGVRRSPGQEGLTTCATCHDSHTAKVREVKGGLCPGCHGEKVMSAGNPHRPNAGEDPCRGCHVPHGATIPGTLWSGPVAASEEPHSGICLGCHAAGGKAGPIPGVAQHPIGPSVGVRPAPEELPLFDLAGNVSRSGGISCATCHDLHGKGGELAAVPNPALLRIPDLTFVNVCTACHLGESNVIGTDHDLAVTAPAMTNVKGLRTEGYGACTPCHLAHAPSNLPALWAQPVPPGLVEPNGFACLMCHRAGGVAAAKVPQVLYRSMKSGAGEAGKPARLANKGASSQGSKGIIFWDDQGRPAAGGWLTCLSCHEPHLWSAGTPGVGEGGNREGDDRTSFLRIASPAQVQGTVCVVCHGNRAAEYYRTYHLIREGKP